MYSILIGNFCTLWFFELPHCYSQQFLELDQLFPSPLLYLIFFTVH